MRGPETREKRLLVIADEPCWPANHGARVDIWNRYSGLKQDGWTIGNVFWLKETRELNAAVRARLETVFSLLLPLKLDRSLSAMARRLALLVQEPSLVAARRLPEAEFLELLERVKNFKPDIIICEQVYSARLAGRLATALNVPLCIRSHNIEHRYMRVQAGLASSLRPKLSATAASLHLERYETEVLKAASCVFDISKQDADFWHKRGVRRIHWVPTLLPDLEATRPAQVDWTDRQYDVCYLGNLWAPNNVSALSWFLDKALPKIRQARPDVKVAVAGANPAPAFAEKLRGTPNVTLLVNPPDADALRSQARVLINPIMKGSGLNTKSIEMLYSDSPVVVTPFAIAGMDDDVNRAFEVADTPEAFATSVVAALHTPFSPNESRLQARRRFGKDGISALSALLDNEIVFFKLSINSTASKNPSFEKG